MLSKASDFGKVSMFDVLDTESLKMVGDLTNATAIFILLVMMFHRKSCLGISGKTQMLLLIVYACRNSDMWLDCHLPHNRTYSTLDTLTRIFFFNATLIAAYLIFIQYRKTYQYDQDLHLMEPLMMPPLLVALYFSVPKEVLWSFGLCLEGLAMVPQLVMIFRSKQIETVVLYFLAVTGFNKVIFIGNWAYHKYDDRWIDEAICGSLQITVYFLAMLFFICRGIKMTSGGKETRLSDMLRSNEGDLTNELNVEKREVCPEKY